MLLVLLFITMFKILLLNLTIKNQPNIVIKIIQTFKTSANPSYQSTQSSDPNQFLTIGETMSLRQSALNPSGNIQLNNQNAENSNWERWNFFGRRNKYES